MADDDLVADAIDELYSTDPSGFTERRTALAAQARADGAKAAARDIAALRKPTQSAYTLNQLVRSDPDVAVQLAELGAHLRTAQDSLDGALLRTLSTQRRGTVEELADRAFRVSAQRSPPPGLREEVISTLNAAVADEGVAAQLGSGTLVRPARWDGFGFASPPELSVLRSTTGGSAPQVPPPSGGSAPRVPPPSGGSAPRVPPPSGGSAPRVPPDSSQGSGGKEAKAAKAAKADERRRQVRADAERAVKDTDSAVAKTAKAEQEQQTRVRLLHEQLTDARRRLDELRIDVRRAETRQRKARQALERLG